MNIFCTLKKHPVLISSHSPFMLFNPSISPPDNQIIYFLFLWICLFLTFHINGFLHLAQCFQGSYMWWCVSVSVLHFLLLKYFPVCIYHIYPFISWWTFKFKIQLLDEHIYLLLHIPLLVNFLKNFRKKLIKINLIKHDTKIKWSCFESSTVHGS